ncbi:MAG TPA: signal peptidase I [Bacilli bacterium]|jgi:signal peptidase|nr:signal peptidase I [Bacilli bacterium]HOE78124.1 signal peptidase I [Bacilli bacterium]HOR96579.1 signal peptidase I [Bacilli bacterium]HPD12783.1 signal peptidase I [Bacilli bacterium]HRS30438.1 signal peptidase I [Bacilli bacterium]
MKKIILRTISGICIVIVIMAMVLIVMGTVSIRKGKLMNAFGYSYSIVASPSMEPAIKTGAIIISKHLAFEDVEIGDIIIYWSAKYNRYIVHRVVNQIDGKLEMKGDNNTAIDEEYVTENNYYGTVVFIGLAFIGIIILKSQSLILGVIVLLFALYLFIEIKDLRSIIKANRKEKEQEEQYQKAREKMREELLKEFEEELKKNS